MDLVKDIQDIRNNMITLESYKDSTEVNKYLDLIKKGICFVVFKTNDNYLFGPSRFLGYYQNSLQKHFANNHKDGKETNPRINKILGFEPEYNELIEKYYLEYCEKLDIWPINRKRKYWLVNFEVETDRDCIITEDINNVFKLKIDETEKESLILSRIGQGKFRNELINLWKGCSVTSINETRILKASHIKPWRFCSNEERLDVYNGFLLIPNLDELFDKGLITFDENGVILFSTVLKSNDLETLGINKKMRIKLNINHKKYLEFHRNKVFQQ